MLFVFYFSSQFHSPQLGDLWRTGFNTNTIESSRWSLLCSFSLMTTFNRIFSFLPLYYRTDQASIHYFLSSDLLCNFPLTDLSTELQIQESKPGTDPAPSSVTDGERFWMKNAFWLLLSLTIFQLNCEFNIYNWKTRQTTFVSLSWGNIFHSINTDLIVWRYNFVKKYYL